MATRKALLKRVAELGCEFQDDGAIMSLDTPQGFRFTGPQVHMLNIFYGRGEWLKPDAYDSLLEDMSMGLESCSDSDCDFCTERSR